MSRRIGVLGGSFDPVHAAHVALARRALEQVPCDEIWFLPAARAVHKPGGAVAGAADRRAMLELALADEPALRLCDLELESPRPLRSVESLRRLREEWPGYRWYFLMGEDSLRSLDTWYRPDLLFAMAPPVVLPRPGSSGPRLDQYAGAPLIWLKGSPLDLDSTTIRETLAAGEVPEGLDPRVLAYVRAHRLYRKQAS